MRGRELYRQPPPGSIVDLQHPIGHGCIGRWEMNVGSGLVVPDISGQNNHGTMTNMDAATDWVQGQFGGEGALELDGLNDHIDCGTSIQCDGDFTLYCRIYPHSWVNKPFPGIMSKRNTYAAMAFMLFYLGTEGLINFWAGNNGTIRLSDILPVPTLNTWSDVVLTRNGSTFQGYLNAVAATPQVDATAIPANTQNFRIGLIGPDDPDPFDGLVSTVAVYERALSAEDVAWLKREPYAPIWTPGERKWWWMGVGSLPLLKATGLGNDLLRRIS